MKVNKNAALPPWIDVTNPYKEFWMSPAMPWLPVRDSYGRDKFDGIVLTALLTEDEKHKKFVEVRLEKRPFVIKANGLAEMCGIDKTLAFGSFPLKKFLDAMEVPSGRKASSRIFTFYEDDMDVATTSVAGGLPYDAQLVVNVCRGYDKPKRFAAGHSYATMTFLFNEGAKSFEKWLERVKCQKC